MKRLCEFGEITQLAYISADVEARIAEWAKIGVGPFFKIEGAPFSSFHYRGVAYNPTVIAAFSYWRGLQIEIVQQTCSSPTVFSRAPANSSGGIHHVCIAVDDIEAAKRRLDGGGSAIVQEAVAAGVGHFIFIDTGLDEIPLVELCQIDPSFDVLFERLKLETVNWDGNRPLRTIGELF